MSDTAFYNQTDESPNYAKSPSPYPRGRHHRSQYSLRAPDSARFFALATALTFALRLSVSDLVRGDLHNFTFHITRDMRT